MDSSRINTLKNQLRCQLRKRLRRLTKFEREQKNRRIFSKLFKTLEFRRARYVFTYMALPYEVQTQEIILKSLALHKHIFVPAIDPKTKEILIYEIWNLKKDFKKGHFGILEPLKRRRFRPDKLDLVLVPGLGFDSKGRRLGRGEGYFDRFLIRTGKAPKIGLAFREQIVRQIPSLKHDIAVNAVITD